MENNKTAAPRDQLQAAYNTARSNLLILVVFTVINIVLLLVESDTMFLFSATVPYVALLMGILTGLTPVIVVCGCIAAISILLYLLCWILSKKSPAWLIVALVFFVIDTAVLALLYISAGEISGIVDFLFHLWVIYYLVVGIINGNKLKKLPEEEEVQQAEITLPDNSIPIRACEEGEKHRILLECDWMGHKIVYRRVKKTNELVIDNHVYDEVTFLMEPPHALMARIDGHTVVAGLNESSVSYISIDNETVKKKLRLF